MIQRKIPRRNRRGMFYLERETRFELATSTLARLHSTTELFPLKSGAPVRSVDINNKRLGASQQKMSEFFQAVFVLKTLVNFIRYSTPDQMVSTKAI